MLPPILVELKANASELHSKIGDASKEIEQLGTAGATHGAKLSAGIKAGFAAAGTAATAFGGLLAAEGMKGTEATVKLETAVKNAGGSMEEIDPKIHQVIGSMANFGHSSSDTETALARLTDATGNPSKALDQMGLVADIAARKHISLTDAANLVGKIDIGKGGKALSEFGLVAAKSADSVKLLSAATKAHEAAVAGQTTAQQKLHDLMERLAGKTHLTVAETQALRNAHEAVDAAAKKVTDTTTALATAQTAAAGSTDNVAVNLENLHKKVMGEAVAQSDTFGGHLASLKAHMENLAEAAGQKVGPALAIAGPIMAGLGPILTGGLIPALANGVVSAVTWSASMVASAVAAAAGWVADMAIMVATSIASAAAMIVPFLPLILTIGAIGVAAYELYTHWDTVWGFIKAAASAAWNVLRGVFDALIKVGLWPIKTEISIVRTVFETVFGAIRTVVQDVWDFLKRAFDNIVGVFRSAIDTISNLPGIGLLKDVLGGGASVLHTLHIPGFAEGGVVGGPIGAPMLAIVHGGETVIPFGGGGGTTTVHQTIVAGPNMNIVDLAAEVRRQFLQAGRGNVNVGLT